MRFQPALTFYFYPHLLFYFLLTSTSYLLYFLLTSYLGFYFYNTLSYQLDGADNQLFSDVLTELTAMVGCAARRWVRDWPVAHKQPWVDGYVLTGMVLGEEGGGDASRLWRFTPHIQDLPTAGDPTASVTSPWTARPARIRMSCTLRHEH